MLLRKLAEVLTGGWRGGLAGYFAKWPGAMLCGRYCGMDIREVQVYNYTQWNLSIEDTIGTQLAVLYTVEPLYRGHHWGPVGCPV